MKTANYLIFIAVIRVMFLVSVSMLAALYVPPQIGAALAALAYISVFGSMS